MVRVERQAVYSRWLPLVKWLLAVPHLVVLVVLGVVKGVLVVVALLAVLVTGRFPALLFGPIEGIQYFNLRLHAYLLMMRDNYPPSSLGEHSWYGVAYDVAEPGRVPRWRAIVQPIIVVPFGIFAQLMMALAWIFSLFAGLTILFRRQYPERVFELSERALEWQVATINYGACITDRYPRLN